MSRSQKTIAWVLALAGIGLAAAFLVPAFLRRAETGEKAAALVRDGEDLLEQAKAADAKAARDLRVKAAAKGEEALRLDPENPAPHLLLGRAHAALENFAKAAEHFDRYLARSPDDPAALRDAGAAYCARFLLSKKTEDRIEAEKNLGRCLSFLPDDPAALLRMGRIAEAEGDMGKRDEFFARLLKAAPDSPEAAAALQKKTPPRR